MQEWILLLHKLVRALENSKLPLLCKKRFPECWTRLRLRQQHPGNQCKYAESKNFYPSLSMLMNQKNPLLHCFFRQQINIPAAVLFLAERSTASQPAAGTRPKAGNCRKDFYLAGYLHSDAKRKRQIIVPCEASVGKPVLAAATEHTVWAVRRVRANGSKSAHRFTRKRSTVHDLPFLYASSMGNKKLKSVCLHKQ